MTTYFISTQTADSMEHIINYICPDNIDVFKTMDMLQNSGPLAEADDHSLIHELAAVDFSKTQFYRTAPTRQP